MQVLRLTLVGLLAAVIFAPSASAGDPTLHPRGFGEHTYAAWKAKSGEQDLTGNAFQSMYFQKFTTTPTPVAAIVEIKGFEGTQGSELTGLAWEHREDGHCGAGAPRWHVAYDFNGVPGAAQLGCSMQATHEHVGEASGHGWCRDEQRQESLDMVPDDATITGLFIIFDEGNDIPNAPPPTGDCPQEQTDGGFVHLDNIEVEINNEPHVWTSAADNGRN